MKQEKTYASAIIAAAGNSSRMGDVGNKQFLSLAGKPVLVHTLLAFAGIEEVREILIVTRGEDIPAVEKLVKQYAIPKVTGVLAGGATRQESVYRGLLQAKEERVLIHDGARPFVTGEEIRRVLEALKTEAAAAPGVPVKDTIKQLDSKGYIQKTLPREELCSIQTPQGFWTREIIAAHRRAEEEGYSSTDDCALAEWTGISVRVVMGNYHNIKITTPEDLIPAEAIQKALQ